MIHCSKEHAHAKCFQPLILFFIIGKAISFHSLLKQWHIYLMVFSNFVLKVLLNYISSFQSFQYRFCNSSRIYWETKPIQFEEQGEQSGRLLDYYGEVFQVTNLVKTRNNSCLPQYAHDVVLTSIRRRSNVMDCIVEATLFAHWVDLKYFCNRLLYISFIHNTDNTKRRIILSKYSDL